MDVHDRDELSVTQIRMMKKSSWCPLARRFLSRVIQRPIRHTLGRAVHPLRQMPDVIVEWIEQVVLHQHSFNSYIITQVSITSTST